MMRAGKVGIIGFAPGAALMMLSNLTLLEAPTETPVANRVNARNKDPIAISFVVVYYFEMDCCKRMYEQRCVSECLQQSISK